MKKLTLLLMYFASIPALFGINQELAAELLDVSNTALMNCNCQQLAQGDQIKIRIQLPEKAYQYDLVKFRYYDYETRKLLFEQQISGKKMRAEYEGQGYFEKIILQKDSETISDKGGGICTQREDYYLIVEADGFFVIGQEETVDRYGVKTILPIYGERQRFGSTNTLPINVSTELRKTANEKKFIRGCATVVVFVLGAIWEVLTME